MKYIDIFFLMEWFRKNSFALNPAKVQTMYLKSNSIKDIQLNVTVADMSLPSPDTMKVLGIDIDDRLTWMAMSQTCVFNEALQRLKGSLDQDRRMAIYKSFIMSTFDQWIIALLFGCLLVRNHSLN